jgi:hypothetical protein
MKIRSRLTEPYADLGLDCKLTTHDPFWSVTAYSLNVCSMSVYGPLFRRGIFR